MKTRLALLMPLLLIFSGCGSEPVETANQDSESAPAGASSSKSSGAPPSAASSKNRSDDAEVAKSNAGETESNRSDESSKPTPPPVQDTMSLLQQAARQIQTNPQGAINVLEKVLDAEPQNRDAISLMAVATQFRGMELATAERNSGNEMLLKSAEYFERLKEMGELRAPEQAMYMQALYNKACTLAILDQPEEALQAFVESVEAGFNDVELIKTDPDLATLRERDDFQATVDRIEEIAKELAKEEAVATLASFDQYPFEFALPNLEGETVSSSDYQDKILIVDFWGTWCPPCRKEIPHFIELYDTYQDQGFEMVGINYERVPEDKVISTIKDFASSFDVDYTCVIGDEETRAQVPQFRGYPTTLFVDGSGRVRAQLVGYHEYEKLEAILVALLDESNSGASGSE